VTVYTKYLVRFDDRDVPGVAAEIRARTSAPIWGIWSGVFGVASNELIVVTADDGARPNVWPSAVQAVKEEPLRATVRPTSCEPLSREGLYVFRAFYLDADAIDRVVELSELAWQTFETSADYQSEPMGLFAPLHASGSCTMYLLTWYDSLQSWQTSRAPHPDARDYFRQRHALMRASEAVATRLLG
jgi:hypothetical protein